MGTQVLLKAIQIQRYKVGMIDQSNYDGTSISLSNMWNARYHTYALSRALLFREESSTSRLYL